MIVLVKIWRTCGERFDHKRESRSRAVCRASSRAPRCERARCLLFPSPLVLRPCFSRVCLRRRETIAAEARQRRLPRADLLAAAF